MRKGIDDAKNIQEDTNYDHFSYKKEEEDDIEIDHRTRPETSELNEETIPTLDEPNEERIVRSGRKKGDTQEVLEEKHRAKLREEEMKLLEQGARRSQRIKERNNVNFILEPEERIPENYEEAINCENKYEWLEAMKEELYSIDKHKVWTLVQREKNMKIINCKWIFSIKSTPSEGVYRRKARLVAIGCNQKYGVEYEESFSPVIRKESIRAIVALAAQLNLVITSYDVKTAYLYGELKETIFMKQPEGFVEKGEEDKVCKLLKSIYGLPQSGNCWNKKINEILIQLGMERSQYDPCVYTFRKGKEYGILGLYMDDLIIAGTDKTFNEKLASEIGRFVALKEKGENEPFIGIEIKKTEYGFDLSQAHYIDKILKKFALEECNIIQTPGDRDQSFDECQDSKPVDRTLYQEMIGSLMYLATGTRPDISFNVTRLQNVEIKRNFSKEKRIKHKKRNERQKESKPRQQAYQMDDKLSFVAMNAIDCYENDHFILDSGATQNLIKSELEKYMTDVKILEHKVEIHMANGEKMSANKSGTLNVKINNIPIAIHGLIVDGIKQNLLSVGKITQQGHQVIFKQDEVIIITRNHNFKCNNYRNLYSHKIEIDGNPESVTAHAVKTDDTLWHRRLGHLNRYSLNKLGLPSSQEKCETCIKGKSTRRSFEKTWKTTKEIGELIHSDLSGPIDPPTYDGEIYFQVLIDDYSHFVVVRLLKSKSEAEQNIIDFIKLIKTQHNKKTRKIRVDNGKEFSSGNFKQFCRTKGIQIEYTSPYTPQQNGTSERMNRTLIDKVRTKLAETNLPKYLWGEAIYCSAYELNRSPTSANIGIPPASIWYKQNDLSKLKVFGSRAWRLILPKPRKLDARAKSTIMVGYSGSGYRIWDPETDKVMISTDVTFDETLIKFYKEIISDQTEPKRIITESQDEEETPQTWEQSDKEESVTTRSGRIIKPPRYQEDYELYSVYCLFTNGEDPVSYNQAIKQKEWKEAIDKEIQSHEELKTWSSIKLGEKSNIKPIDTKWIFRTKEDGTKKACLVAKGFQMEESSDIMYAPVARMSTIRMLLSHAINKNWE
ncbi:hypothetical protein LAZ67_1001766, partial [Cordylochernes scorpioides]